MSDREAEERGLRPARRARSRRLLLPALAVALALPVAVTAAETVKNQKVIATFDGRVSPTKLPRHGSAPVTLHMRGSVRAADLDNPPELKRMTVAINRHARISVRGLPTCRLLRIKAATTRQAIQRCGDSLIGRGRFTAHIAIPDIAPFPAFGRIRAFAGRHGGRRAILVHIYGTEPVPTSNVLPLAFARSERGTFRTKLSMQMPKFASGWGYVTGFRMALHRVYRFRGKRRSLIRAGCPAPRGFTSVRFPAARGTYLLAGGRKVSRLLYSTCRVAG